MSKLNRDVLRLIIEELQDDRKTLYSFLLVNKIYCEIIVPILWKNPWKFMTKVKRKSLSKIIISHLSNETKNNLKNQEINIFKNSYQKPLFDYISFCRHLNLGEIKEIIYIIYSSNEVYEKSKILIIMNEILKLFFNENRKFTHLYIPKNFDYQIYHIPGARRHLSEIEFLSCNTSMNDNILIGLIDICKSIKELELSIDVDNYGIIKLIKTREKLISLSLLESYYINKSPFDKIIENSLATHTNTLQNFKINRRPTKIPSFINLKVLELEDRYFGEWNCLENLSLPFLQILRTSFISIKPLTNLIKNTNRSLIEIKIDGVIHDEIGNKNIIQAIYKNCPKLKYLKLMFRNCNILELENLLTNCQHLKVLSFVINDIVFEWENLFKILIKLSPNDLFKFKFHSFDYELKPKLEFLKLFFNNWKGKRPIFLNFNNAKEIEYWLHKYETEGMIKNCDDIELENY
ncbi:hypothetical protein RhiirA5_497968 [Rhizophagus irregularis]|uniref:F-box domain-containing protein n=1 Tax=Rhizophagus irregularis TaxID=588596 RepID=A0A2N0PW67_9GLOM|nr:hypothetical protein RhiirA5_497968 [Rhizophagus irregularis]